MEQQKDRLKENAYNEVLKALQPFVEGENIPDEDAPIRVCHRYISNRTHQLDYKGAIAAGLPIGSGGIESAHRYVIQARLKLAGAWWKIKNAKNTRPPGAQSQWRLGQILEQYASGGSLI